MTGAGLDSEYRLSNTYHRDVLGREIGEEHSKWEESPSQAHMYDSVRAVGAGWGCCSENREFLV